MQLHPSSVDSDDVEGEWACLNCSSNASAGAAAAAAAGPRNYAGAADGMYGGGVGGGSGVGAGDVIRRSGRATKNRIISVNGESVLVDNMYDLEDGEPTIADEMARRRGARNAAVAAAQTAQLSEATPTAALAMLPLLMAGLQQVIAVEMRMQGCRAAFGRDLCLCIGVWTVCSVHAAVESAAVC